MTTTKQKQKLALTWHVDDGHEWLPASRQQLMALGLTHKSISPYSYTHPTHGGVYAEGDCDAIILYRAAKSAGLEIVAAEQRHAGHAPCKRYVRCGSR